MEPIQHGTTELLEGLSPSLKSVWAKTGMEDGDPFGLWLPLVGHAMDAAGVAAFLWDTWLSPSQRDVISACFPVRAGTDRNSNFGVGAGSAPTDVAPEPRAKEFITLAAGIHDIGKISKPFARQVGRFADQMAEQSLNTASNQSVEAKESRWMKHALAGAIAIEKAGPALGWHPTVTTALATLAGGHHGIPTQKDQLRRARAELHRLVDDAPEDPWQDTQREFAEFTASFANARANESVSLTVPALVLIQGLVMVADWISSSDTYFPLVPAGDRQFGYLAACPQAVRVERALAKLSLPPQWRPRDKGEGATELLAARFHLPHPARPLQDLAVRTAREMGGPGLLIIEDAMGSGKTEAGFLAAEVLGARFGANGLVVALPTQATTDAMFARLLRFLQFGVISEDGERLPPSLSLIHGRSQWNSEFVGMERTGRSYLDQFAAGIDVDLGGGTVDVDGVQSAKPHALVHSWLRGRNKALLASFVATTVDHLLMGALQMKHLALRHLGLSSKVVIFDEVHASSRFMNFFAERIVEWLGAYRVPVVMLSATLDSQLRERLAAAYRRGLSVGSGEDAQIRGRRTQRRRGERERGTDGEPLLGARARDEAEPLDRAAAKLPPGTHAVGVAGPSATSADEGVIPLYPRITAVTASGVQTVPVPPATKPRAVKIVAEPLTQSPSDVVKRLAAEGEGNILLLVNTVTRAQAAYDHLHAEYGDSVHLVHSRFTAAHRMENDQWLLQTYGPDGGARPRFSIVVATQVAEQSLDIDFDVLVTDVAPVDLILQRIGRVYRHAGRMRPRALREAVCHLIGVPLFDRAPDLNEPALCSAGSVYGLKPVLSGLLALGPRLFEGGAAVELPADIGVLVERAALGRFEIPDAWIASLERARERWDREEHEAAAEIAQTRLGPPGKRRGRIPTLDDWYGIVPGADDGTARRARARVRDGLEGLDVVLLQAVGEDVYTMPNDEDREGVFLPWDVLPTPGVARQALLGTVTLPAWAIGDTDAAIGVLEDGCWGSGWAQSHQFSGQLFLPLVNGEAELAGHVFRYSRQTGLEVERGR